MPLTIACTCGQHYSVDEQYAGQQVPCSVCGQLIYIPVPAVTAPVTPPPAPHATAHGPYEADPFEQEPAPRRGGGAIVPLFVAVLFILVIGGGLGGVWWMLQQNDQQRTGTRDKPKEQGEGDDVVAPVIPPKNDDDRQKEEPRDNDKDKDKDKEKDKNAVVVEKDKDKARDEEKDKDAKQSKLPPPSDQRWKGHEAAILAVAVDRGGKHVWTASGAIDDKIPDDCTLRRWDASTGKETDRLELTERGIAAAAFDADGKRAAVAVPGKSAIELWDLTTKKKLATLDEHRKPVHALAFSGDGRRLVSAGEDRLVIVWDLGTNKPLHTLVGHTNTIDAVAVSHDGRAVVSGGRDLSAKVWDLGKGEQARELSGHADVVWAAAFSHDGKLALTGGGMQQVSPTVFVAGARDHDVRCWDASEAKEKSRAKPLAVAVTTLAFSPDSRRYLAGGNDGSLRLWQLGTNKEVMELKGHSARVRAVAFFAEGRKAVSVSDDKTIRVWDLPSDLPEMARDVRGKDAAARTAALTELTRLGAEAKPAIPDLFAAVALGDNAWKGDVIDLLKTFSPLDAQHVPQLEVLLQDKKYTPGRLYAVDELAKLGEGSRPAAKTLLAAVADEDLQVRRGALTALTPIVDEVSARAFQPLLTALRDKDASMRAQAEKALEKLGPVKVEHLGLLEKLLREDGTAIKRFALKALGELGEAAVTTVSDVAERATSDTDAEVRRQALEALAKIAPTDDRTLVAATKALDDRNSGVYRQAAKTLTATKDVPALLVALEHDDAEVSKTADEALKKVRFSKAHLGRLIKLVQSKREPIRGRGIEALGDLGGDAAGAVPALSKAFQNAEETEQNKLLTLFVKMGAKAKAAGKVVLPLMKTKDKVGQLEICQVLVKIEAPEVAEAVPSLVAQLKPTAEDVMDEDAIAHRVKVRKMLVEIGKPAVDPMLDALGVKYAGGRGDDAVLNAVARLALVKALGEMGPVAYSLTTMRALSNLRLRENEPVEEIRVAARDAYSAVQPPRKK